MEGNWTAGVLTGAATYSQPAFQLSANYTKGVPEGAATFTTASFRSLRGALDFLSSCFRCKHTLAALLLGALQQVRRSERIGECKLHTEHSCMHCA